MGFGAGVRVEGAGGGCGWRVRVITAVYFRVIDCLQFN